MPTKLGLKQRFEKVKKILINTAFYIISIQVYKLARRTALIDEKGGGPLEYLTSWFQSLVMFEVPSNACSPDYRIDISQYEPFDLLSKTRHFVEQGDLENAVRVANLLRLAICLLKKFPSSWRRKTET